jgi:Protein of unknown function (DUF2478)
MDIAYTMAPGRGDTDLLLHRLAQSLIAEGLRPVGTVQINTERNDAGPCDMDVKVLPDGPIVRISQSLGLGSRGCRLDPCALEVAVGCAAAELAKGADCLIVNKFGKHEVEGRGFRPLIAEAFALDIPVLVGLNGLNSRAFLAFIGGLGVRIEPCDDDLGEWARRAIGHRRKAA